MHNCATLWSTPFWKFVPPNHSGIYQLLLTKQMFKFDLLWNAWELGMSFDISIASFEQHWIPSITWGQLPLGCHVVAFSISYTKFHCHAIAALGQSLIVLLKWWWCLSATNDKKHLSDKWIILMMTNKHSRFIVTSVIHCFLLLDLNSDLLFCLSI